jgi:hypothetical protein
MELAKLSAWRLSMFRAGIRNVVGDDLEVLRMVELTIHHVLSLTRLAAAGAAGIISMIKSHNGYVCRDREPAKEKGDRHQRGDLWIKAGGALQVRHD